MGDPSRWAPSRSGSGPTPRAARGFGGIGDRGVRPGQHPSKQVLRRASTAALRCSTPPTTRKAPPLAECNPAKRGGPLSSRRTPGRTRRRGRRSTCCPTCQVPGCAGGMRLPLQPRGSGVSWGKRAYQRDMAAVYLQRADRLLRAAGREGRRLHFLPVLWYNSRRK